MAVDVYPRAESMWGMGRTAVRLYRRRCQKTTGRRFRTVGSGLHALGNAIRCTWYVGGFAASWYNGHRPHMTLKGSTPDEVYQGRHPTCRYPRFEPRPNWPARSPCARPGVPIRGRPGQRFELNVEFEAVRKHLPNVTLRRAA